MDQWRISYEEAKDRIKEWMVLLADRGNVLFFYDPAR
jgi:hypothetical protein